jgi:hypothetical protein
MIWQNTSEMKQKKKFHVSGEMEAGLGLLDSKCMSWLLTTKLKKDLNKQDEINKKQDPTEI